MATLSCHRHGNRQLQTLFVLFRNAFEQRLKDHFKSNKMMIGREIVDKVTEYRILNEQLMSKAMALLESADTLMSKQDTDEAKIDRMSNLSKFNLYDNDLVDSTLEYYKSVDPIDFENLPFPSKNGHFDDENVEKITTDLNVESNVAFDEFMKSKDKMKTKLTFPSACSESDRPVNLEDGDDLNGSSENEEERKTDIETMQNTIEHQKESDNIVERLLKTKLSLQQNGCNANAKMMSVHKKSIDSPENVSLDRVNNNCIKFLKSKIETQQEEMQSIREKLKKKTIESEELSKGNQSLQETKVRLMTQINNLKSQAIKKDGKITILNSKIQALENECRAVKNEHESLVKNTKGAAQENSGTEMRMTRALKEVASLKETLNDCRQQEKEIKESSRRQLDELSSGIKAAEKREKTLLTALKKQALLIDNLKKQIIYLTAKKDIDNAEKQLDSVLKWENK